MNGKLLLTILVSISLRLAIAHGPDVSSVCQDCICRGTKLRCVDLTYFPASFPVDVTELSFRTLNVEALPPDSFKKLDNLKKLSFSRSNIGVIESCAFNHLPNLTEMTFIDTVVGKVEKMAFKEMETPTKIRFLKSRISVVKPFAFYKMSKIIGITIENTTVHAFQPASLYNLTDFQDGFRIVNSTLDTIHRHAFQHVDNIGAVEFSSNVIMTMACASIDNFISTQNNLVFNKNYLMCDCGLGWVKDRLDLFATSGANFKETYCYGPDIFQGKTVLQAALMQVIPCTDGDKFRSKLTVCKEREPLKIKSICPARIPNKYGKEPKKTKNRKPGDNSADNIQLSLTVLTLSFFLAIL